MKTQITLLRTISLILFATFFSAKASAFVLVEPGYQLANPTDTVVNIANGGCRAINMSDDTLRSAIQNALDNYWNTVGESRLKMRLGSEVTTTLAQTAAARGEVLIGCANIGAATNLGATYPNSSNGSAVVILNSNSFSGAYDSRELNLTVIHELGHAVGLGHSNDDASVMTYRSNSWRPSATYLSQDDKDGVVYLYPNESTLGLFGSCSSLASKNGQVGTVTWSDLMGEALMMILVALTVQFLLRRVLGGTR